MILISFFSQYLIDAINQSITLQKIKILPHYAYHVRDDHTQFSIYTYTYNPHQYGDGKIVCNTTLYMRLNCEFSSHNKRNDDDRRNCVEHKRDNFSPGTIFLSNMLYTDWDDVVTGKTDAVSSLHNLYCRRCPSTVNSLCTNALSTFVCH